MPGARNVYTCACGDVRRRSAERLTRKCDACLRRKVPVLCYDYGREDWVCKACFKRRHRELIL
jgi:hypothetical protein